MDPSLQLAPWSALCTKTLGIVSNDPPAAEACCQPPTRLPHFRYILWQCGLTSVRVGTARNPPRGLKFPSPVTFWGQLSRKHALRLPRVLRLSPPSSGPGSPRCPGRFSPTPFISHGVRFCFSSALGFPGFCTGW